jgi:hypothetical protein
MNLLWRLALAALPAVALAAVAATPASQPQEFAWRAAIGMQPGASVARVRLPADAMTRLRSADARDLRIFNASGEAVPMAFVPARAASAAVERTPAFPAFALRSASGKLTASGGNGPVTVTVGQGADAVRVDIAGRPATAAANEAAPQSAIFDTRAARLTMDALQVHAQLPEGRIVSLELSTSTDLANWTPLAVPGRLYRFDGASQIANDTLRLAMPVSLEGRFLRVDWTGQDGVQVQEVTGLAHPAGTPPRVVADLPAPRADGGALEWELPFATPMAALRISASHANTLVPVRVLARDRADQPWREAARGVVWRVGAPGQEALNPPLLLPGVRTQHLLRLEATQAVDLAAAQLQVRAEFAPVEMVFVASGTAPFQLAAGRADTPSAALPLATLAPALGGRRADEIALASVGAGVVTPDAGDGFFAQARMPRALAAVGLTGRTAMLWAILLVGVLLLGAVAWKLLRQLQVPPADNR